MRVENLAAAKGRRQTAKKLGRDCGDIQGQADCEA
jgi:hypothetical protein